MVQKERTHCAVRQQKSQCRKKSQRISRALWERPWELQNEPSLDKSRPYPEAGPWRDLGMASRYMNLRLISKPLSRVSRSALEISWDFFWHFDFCCRTHCDSLTLHSVSLKDFNWFLFYQAVFATEGHYLSFDVKEEPKKNHWDGFWCFLLGVGQVIAGIAICAFSAGMAR